MTTRGGCRSLAAVALALSACASSDDTGGTGTGGSSAGGGGRRRVNQRPARRRRQRRRGRERRGGRDGISRDGRRRGHDRHRRRGRRDRTPAPAGTAAARGAAGQRRARPAQVGSTRVAAARPAPPARRHDRSRWRSSARAAAGRPATAGKRDRPRARGGTTGGRGSREPARRVRAGREIYRAASRRCSRRPTDRTSVPIRRSRSRFSGTPTLGSSGRFRVFTSGGSAVATVDMAAATVTETIGGMSFTVSRPVYVDGNTRLRHAAAEGARLRA